jgi:hypothetical protein
MLWESIAFGLVIGGGIHLWKGLRGYRSCLQGWRDAASSCGLEVVEISSPFAMRLKLEAQKGPLTVRIGVRHGRDYATWVVVSGAPGFYGVRIRREHNKPAGLREIEIGDDRFDSTFWVEGPSQLVGLLNPEMRHLLLRLNARSRFEIVDSELRAGTFDKDLASVLPLVVDIAQRFAQRVDVVSLLVEGAHRDPMAKVRLQKLLILVREFPKDPRAIEALRTACKDASVQVRLRAARELGAEARDVLVEIAESTEDDGCSAEAVTILGRELEVERLRAILILALRRRRIRTAVACLEALGHSGEAAAVAILAKVLGREKTELAATAARALGWTGSPDAEPPLILALERDDLDLQMSAAIALGYVGSAAAIVPLKDAARASRNEQLHRLVRQAVAEIHSRLPAASAGQLSLAGAEVGQLSLAPAQAGQLSLANDSAGQLSLGDAEKG